MGAIHPDRLNEVMSQLNSTALAQQLSVTKARISQYVAEGKLTGCYVGDGRARRFDLDAVLAALGKKLDKGQMMGNGAGTRRVMAALKARELGEDEDPAPEMPKAKARPTQVEGAELDPQDPDRYELARTLKVEQEARRLLRNNAVEEGTLLLASEVSRQTARLVAQEVAQFENVLREGARSVADRLGVDYKTVRQILLVTWRDHRANRADALDSDATSAERTQAEVEADI